MRKLPFRKRLLKENDCLLNITKRRMPLSKLYEVIWQICQEEQCVVTTVRTAMTIR